MPERVTVREDHQIILIDSFGDITAEDLQRSLEAVDRIRRERGYARMLVDASMQASLPGTLSLHEFAEHLAGALEGLKIAVVVSPVTDRDMGFLETAARNRGVQMRAFDSHEAALDWLT